MSKKLFAFSVQGKSCSVFVLHKHWWQSFKTFRKVDYVACSLVHTNIVKIYIWNELMYGILNETIRNMATRVIREHSFDFRGWEERFILSDLFSHWIKVQITDCCNWQDPIIFFSKVQIKTFTFMNTGVHLIIRVTSKKNPRHFNSLLSGSSSCVKLSIFNILAIRLFIVIMKEIKLFIFAIFFKSHKFENGR